MRLQLWGSAAAERVPAMFCHCAACELARKKGGKYIRTEAQVLIDESLLVDFGQDTFLHFLTYGFDFTRLRDLLITHVHPDHFSYRELDNTRAPYAHNDMETLHVHGGDGCGALMATLLSDKVDFSPIRAYETQEIGGYTVTALPARHDEASAYCYIISDGKKTVLYNHDTGLYQDEAVYDFIRERGFRFDAVLSDATSCLRENYTGWRHMTLADNVTLRDRLQKEGALTDDTLWVLTHFSHNGLVNALGTPVTVEALEEIARAHGMTCAYDGMTLTL